MTSRSPGAAARRLELELVAGDELVREAQRVQREHAVERPDDRDVLAVVEGEAPDRRPARPLERVVQQPVGVLGLLPAPR